MTTGTTTAPPVSITGGMIPPEPTLWESIVKVNLELEHGEPGNVTTDNRNYTGYEVQAIIDAVNKYIGPENWTYTVISMEEIQPKIFEVQLTIAFRYKGEWITKGIQYGGGRGDRDLTDGKKAAITDGLKKAFSAWSIGRRAFLGLLDKKASPHQEPMPDRKPTRQEPDGAVLSPNQLTTLSHRVAAIRNEHGKAALTKEGFAAALHERFGPGVSTLTDLTPAQYTPALDLLTKIDTDCKARKAG